MAATLVAYLSLAEYDRIALIHLGRNIPWPFVMVTSFTTYSLSHNIGASLLSGTIIRFRAYGSRGLSPGRDRRPGRGHVVHLPGRARLTLGGVVMVIKPSVDPALLRPAGLDDDRRSASRSCPWSLFYLIGSLFHFKPLTIAGFHIYYPKPNVVIRQLIIGPVELIAAAAIIYFCLPAEGNPGFITVVGVFVASFSMAIVSHAPGGLGVLEYVFLTGLDDMDQAQVLAALIVFRLLYLLLPFAAALVIVLVFERSEFRRSARERLAVPGQPEAPEQRDAPGT